MGDFLTRLGVNFLNHKLKITRGGIEVDNGNISGSTASTGSFGYLNVDGDTVIGGNLTLGDAATDSISFSAEINSNLIPDADSTYNIGSTSKNWKYGYIEEFSATNITSSNNISASGNIYGSGNLDIDGTSNFAGDATLQSDLNVSGNITGSSVSASSGAFSTINVDGGTVDGTNVTVGSGKTLDVSAGTLTTSAAQKAAIVEGVGANVDIGAYDFRANTVIADDLTSGRVVFTTTNGQLTDDSDLSFDTATLTATNLTSTGTIKDFGLVSGSSVSTGSIARMKVIDRIDVGNGTSTEPSINFVSDGDTGFFLESADDIGVSLGAVEEFRFANGGNFHADADVVAFSSTVASDARLKENVEDISYGLGDVLQLRGVEFDWKKEGRGHDIGFIAQEVQSVIPEIVKEVDGLNGKESHLTVNYAAVVPVLVESIKTLKEEIDNIKENCKCLKK